MFITPDGSTWKGGIRIDGQDGLRFYVRSDGEGSIFVRVSVFGAELFYNLLLDLTWKGDDQYWSDTVLRYFSEQNIFSLIFLVSRLQSKVRFPLLGEWNKVLSWFSVGGKIPSCVTEFLDRYISSKRRSVRDFRTWEGKWKEEEKDEFGEIEERDQNLLRYGRSVKQSQGKWGFGIKMWMDLAPSGEMKDRVARVISRRGS